MSRALLPHIDRRSFIKLSAVASLTLLVGCGSDDSPTDNTTNQKLLPIPELLQPDIIGNVKHYNLTIKESKHQFFDEAKTDTYAINGTYLAPTIKVIDGDEVSINFKNSLNEATTMHGHGMHVPAKMDGTPHQVIEPDKSWSARYRVKQKAATNWYHPHFMGKTADHVYKGLAGFIVVEDEESRALDLPDRYGIDDIPLVLQDRRFVNSQFDYTPTMQEVMRGYIGDTFIVNGAIKPTFEAEAKEIRFRLLNGSNSTVYELGFSDNRSFNQIATDNALLESPVALNRVTLSPGERAEIVVDFSGDLGKSVDLYEYKNSKTFLQIDIKKQATATTSLPNKLTSLVKLNPLNSATSRTFTLSGRMGSFQINGKSMDIDRIDEVVPLNAIEIWEVKNSMMVDHNFHIHATHFMIIERNGNSAGVAANERGYKDTVYIKGGESVKFIVKMVDYTDTKIPYMYHCHFLEHEDRGMMGQFVVT